MTFVQEIVKQAKLRNWQEIDFIIESYRGTNLRYEIEAGENSARSILARKAEPLPDDVAAAVWDEFKRAPAAPGVRK